MKGLVQVEGWVSLSVFFSINLEQWEESISDVPPCGKKFSKKNSPLPFTLYLKTPTQWWNEENGGICKCSGWNFLVNCWESNWGPHQPRCREVQRPNQFSQEVLLKKDVSKLSGWFVLRGCMGALEGKRGPGPLLLPHMYVQCIPVDGESMYLYTTMG